MGELIKIDFGRKDTNQPTNLEKEPVTLIELYKKIFATKITPEIVSSFHIVLEPYTFDELVDFMQQISNETVAEKKLGFVKAVQQQIKRKQPKK